MKTTTISLAYALLILILFVPSIGGAVWVWGVDRCLVQTWDTGSCRGTACGLENVEHCKTTMRGHCTNADEEPTVDYVTVGSTRDAYACCHVSGVSGVPPIWHETGVCNNCGGTAHHCAQSCCGSGTSGTCYSSTTHCCSSNGTVVARTPPSGISITNSSSPVCNSTTANNNCGFTETNVGSGTLNSCGC